MLDSWWRDIVRRIQKSGIDLLMPDIGTAICVSNMKIFCYKHFMYVIHTQNFFSEDRGGDFLALIET